MKYDLFDFFRKFLALKILLDFLPRTHTIIIIMKKDIFVKEK